LRGLNEIWLTNRRIRVTDEEYEEIKAACVPAVYAKEIEIAPRKVLTPKELTQLFERNLDMVEQEVVEELRRVGDTTEYEDCLYERIDKDKVSWIVRKARQGF
jgi:hypothetical protein